MLLLAPASTFAQPAGRGTSEDTFAGVANRPEWNFGYELFQMLLEEHGLVVSADLEDVLAHPDDSVVVLLGETGDLWRSHYRRLMQFTSRGGHLLIATDCSAEIGELRVGPVRASSAEDQYLDFADCVRVTDIADAHPLMKDISELVFNRTGWFQTPPPTQRVRWTVLATLPADCMPRAASGMPVLMAGETVSAVEGRWFASGRIVMTADQSLFTNSMLWHGDNAVLAIRVAEYLCEQDRRRLLVISEGVTLPGYRESPVMQPEPSLTPPPIEPPEPKLATMLKVANRVIREVEDSNLLNEVLANQPRRVRQPAWQKIVLTGLAIVALVFVIWKLAQQMSLKPPLPTERDMLSSLAMNGAGRSLPTELGIAAEMLCRDLCCELTGSTVPTDWQKFLNDAPVIAHRVLKRTQRAGLREIVKLAVEGNKAHISPRRFRQLGSMITQLRAIHREAVATVI